MNSTRTNDHVLDTRRQHTVHADDRPRRAVRDGNAHDHVAVRSRGGDFGVEPRSRAVSRTLPYAHCTLNDPPVYALSLNQNVLGLVISRLGHPQMVTVVRRVTIRGHYSC
ncbi:hypothetical protein AMAG_20567 [Allomyces macrogynus ATCC 38327]|uniref:Uncharacterized protein n=1 Tax=Allomyces macrogynus (strain ATCC 38327) TaxID=578462 RepID=A0A0L0TC49_ALLM3|nr:hypothetical protein AMAG_20567 [Allomyces macrogynus ATCC 38327]|eukprot:KNE72327.1 hypothetical protein AMAG_20567 [Allomyces macrogynus ATCC 38327]